MDSLFLDVRYALRSLAKKPSFTAVILLTFALGIGANTAIFSIVYGVLLKPLGYPEESRLYAIDTTNLTEGIDARANFLPDFWFWRENSTSFEEMTFYGWRSMTLEEPGQVQQLGSVAVSWNLFRLLGVSPELGRGFTPEDEIPGRGQVVLLSHGLWQRVYGGDPEIVGRTIILDREAKTVIGVMPPTTDVPSQRAELWIPVGFFEDYERSAFGREERDFIVLGRLAQTITREMAQGELDRFSERLGEMFPETNEGWSARLVPIREFVAGDARGPILAAFAAVGLVLVIACTNIANLLLVRAATREREQALRSALGAGRGRLLRQLTTESLLLAFAGGGLGLAVAVGLSSIILTYQPGILPRSHTIGFQAPVLAVALVTMGITGCVFGLVSTFRRRPDLSGALKQGGGLLGSGRSQNRARLVLVGSQMALALTLLAGAGLLIQTLSKLSRVDPGFRPEGTFASHILLDNQSYGRPEARRVYYKRLGEAVRQIPGVTQAALTTATPVENVGIQIDVPYRGNEGPLVTEPGAPRAAFRVITPGYLETIGIPLLSGRDFTAQDTEQTPLVVLVSETLASRAFPGVPAERVVGNRLAIFAYGERQELEVIGITADTRFAGLDVAPRPELFLPHPQLPFLGMAVVARTTLSEAAYDRALRQAVLAIDPSQPIMNLRSLSSELYQTLASERFYTILLGLFAGVALLLAAAGIYGVFAHWVSQRTREMGLRLALGAPPGAILRLVLSRAAVVTAISLAVGLFGTYGIASILSNAFRGIESLDPLVALAAATLLSAVALLACWMPARQAARIDPTRALRSE